MSLGRGFRQLWAGSAAGNLSDGLIFVAIPLLATSLTTDAILIAGLAAMYSAVRLLVVVPVGVYVDRFDRRTILWITNLSRAALLVIMAVLFAIGLGSIPLLYIVLAGVGILETAADNAALSILPSVVPANKLDQANSRISAAQLVADEFAGPPLGGFLFALGVAVPVLAAGGLYTAAGFFFLALPRKGAVNALSSPRRSVFREAADGASWLRGHRLLSGLAVVGGLASVAYMMPFSVLVLFAQHRLGLGPAGYGLILAISALGGLVGSIVAAPLRSRVGYGWTIVGSLCLGAVAMFALAFVRIPWVAAALLAAYILHSVVWGICVGSLRQRLVPEGLRGRVNASSKVLGLIGLTVGAALGGVLASSLSLSVPFLVSGALFVSCGAIVRWLFRSDRQSSGSAKTPWTNSAPGPTFN
ncbi:Predicted arabinose efflux permease, MFS family [Cryobacterium psychrotolerans]|uniref:Predicted arabinose efflux permease, MFS family n=1 Tax=Cryobacterium psychrotolerans TaxID=386301 RepID=A0A1G9H703_9MICO|nr:MULTISPECIES: MFS transporter [Cryobacterium]TFD44695.1 MFS transporter [Cryobacterium sp. TMT1-2-1]TFD83465.1 MFS transporter [Cryobacterium psychrotolerans]SDL08741.1 Predicted arabinose efflux permease, MFS family [Cryobacterium psychrotolerans]